MRSSNTLLVLDSYLDLFVQDIPGLLDSLKTRGLNNEVQAFLEEDLERARLLIKAAVLTLVKIWARDNVDYGVDWSAKRAIVVKYVNLVKGGYIRTEPQSSESPKAEPQKEGKRNDSWPTAEEEQYVLKLPAYIAYDQLINHRVMKYLIEGFVADLGR